MNNGAGQESGVDRLVPPAIRPGLAMLLQACRYAGEFKRDCWDFAVEISSLHAAGLNRSHMRWLICKGYVKHARENMRATTNDRAFRQCGGLTLTNRTAFVLTESGRAVAESLSRESGSSESPGGHAVAGEGQPPILPRWDQARHEFRLGERLVKVFKLPSSNQETILTAFEEEGWPPHIDDPLPPTPDLDPKRRLHDTIKGLNRNQKNRLIRFRGDGTGEGVCWTLVSQDG